MKNQASVRAPAATNFRAVCTVNCKLTADTANLPVATTALLQHT
jgi:hypothetical protein